MSTLEAAGGCTRMKIGDTIVCVASRGYAFTEGREYVLDEYEPARPDGHFTWPAYLHVLDDNKKMAICHTYRFKLKGQA